MSLSSMLEEAAKQYPNAKKGSFRELKLGTLLKLRFQMSLSI